MKRALGKRAFKRALVLLDSAQSLENAQILSAEQLDLRAGVDYSLGDFGTVPSAELADSDLSF